MIIKGYTFYIYSVTGTFQLLKYNKYNNKNKTK